MKRRKIKSGLCPKGGSKGICETIKPSIKENVLFVSSGIFNMTYLKSKVLVGSEIQEEVILETTSLVMESNLLSKGQWRCNQNEHEVERKTFNINKWVNWTRHEALSCWCFQELSYLILSFHSPSTANSDKYLIPPDNITPQSHSKGNDHQLKKLLIVKWILLVNTLGIV